MNINSTVIINEEEYSGTLAEAPNMLKYRYAARICKTDRALAEKLCGELGIDFFKTTKFALLDEEQLVVVTSEYKPCIMGACQSDDEKDCCEK